jgi:hypothetical protein
MDDLRATIGRLRDAMTQWLEAGGAAARPADVGALVREQVVRLLKRRDLRLKPEVLLHDLRNVFTGYETLDHENQRQAVEDAMRVVEEFETLLAAERVLNPDRAELPDPPAFMAATVKSQIERIKQDAREQRDRMQHEALTQRIGQRRPHPHPHPRGPARPLTEGAPVVGEKGRVDLVFTDSRAVDNERRGDRRPRPPRRGPEAPPAEAGAKPPFPPGPDAGAPRGNGAPPGDRPHGFNRRHRHRRKK